MASHNRAEGEEKGKAAPAIDRPRIERAVREILLAIGEDPERESLCETPARVARMYEELFCGLHADPGRHLKKVFTDQYDEMVLVRDISFNSMCEHHLLPFMGKAHIGYLPRGKVTGLSKLARVVEEISKRPQVQERMTHQIADLINADLDPKGVIVILEAEHTCMTIRGIRKPGSLTVTSAVRGLLKTNPASRAEAMALINGAEDDDRAPAPMIAQFALRLVCGISLVWVVLPRKEITSGFFRIQMLLALSLSALAALTLGHFVAPSDAAPLLPAGTGQILCGVLAGIAYLGSIAWTLERQTLGNACVYAVAVLSSGILLGSSLTPGTVGTRLGVLAIASELATSLLIGTATAGMLLGHWYLTVPTMSIAPLGRANVCFGSAAVLRLVISLAGLILVWPALNGGTPVLWLVLRWTAGIAGPMVLALMVAQLRYRNTQAATGVLFVGVIVTFIGELSATLVSRELHVPL